MQKPLCVAMSMFALFAVATTTDAQSVAAQTPSRIVVKTTAPVFVKPDAAMTPLRLAKEGSALNVIGSDGEWYRVEFDDPQFGRRVGYIETRHVTALSTVRKEEAPVDLTTPVAKPAQVMRVAQEALTSYRTSSPEKGWIDVNVGMAQAREESFSTLYTSTLFRETASFATAYEFPRGASFDFGGGYMISPMVGLGISFTGTAHTSAAGLGVTIPHPTLFNRSATAANVTENELERTEGAAHIQLVFKAPIANDALRLRFFGGPSYFNLKGDAVSSIEYDQVYSSFFGTNSVAITGYETVDAEGSGWGFHAGADVAFMFSKHFGLGGVVRFSSGTVAVDASDILVNGDAYDVKVGGFQTAGGLRVRF